jgi:hypothetical protein
MCNLCNFLGCFLSPFFFFFEKKFREIYWFDEKISDLLKKSHEYKFFYKIQKKKFKIF